MIKLHLSALFSLRDVYPTFMDDDLVDKIYTTLIELRKTFRHAIKKGFINRPKPLCAINGQNLAKSFLVLVLPLPLPGHESWP